MYFKRTEPSGKEMIIGTNESPSGARNVQETMVCAKEHFVVSTLILHLIGLSFGSYKIIKFDDFAGRI